MKKNKREPEYFVENIYPSKMTAAEEQRLADFIHEQQAKMSPQRVLEANQFAFLRKIEHYLEDETKYIITGNFIREYLNIIGIKQKDFAEQLDIHPTSLNNLIKNRIRLNAELAFKLEAHSDIPATLWIRIQQKDELFQMMQQDDLRLEASRKIQRFVQNQPSA